VDLVPLTLRLLNVDSTDPGFDSVTVEFRFQNAGTTPTTSQPAVWSISNIRINGLNRVNGTFAADSSMPAGSPVYVNTVRIAVNKEPLSVLGILDPQGMSGEAAPESKNSWLLQTFDFHPATKSDTVYTGTNCGLRP
jgi:hypothetical protein